MFQKVLGVWVLGEGFKEGLKVWQRQDFGDGGVYVRVLAGKNFYLDSLIEKILIKGLFIELWVELRILVRWFELFSKSGKLLYIG